MRRIVYREGFKYQLHEAFKLDTPIMPTTPIEGRFLSITATGFLTVRPGYAWDGPSGPTFDTPGTMRAALVHDALYQLMRMRAVDVYWRARVDDLFYDLLREDGVNRVRAWFWWRAVRRLAGPAATNPERPIKVAP